MSVGARLGVFLLVLLGTFGTAYAVGERLPGHSHSGLAHTHEPGSLVPPGYQSGNYQLVTDSIAQGSDGGRLATFHLEMADGMRVTEFTEAHGALLHNIVVRPDLSGFQHLHPDIADDGSWQVAVTEPGQWHLVFEGTPTDAPAPVVVSANLDDEAVVEPVPLPEPDDDLVVDGLRIRRTGLNFTVTSEDGEAAEGLEPYLGQPAHLVALRQGDLSYVHLHPSDTDMTGMYMFGDRLPDAGTYRLFLQFGHDGDVLTVPFTVIQE
ncbi:MAG: hypothetical protein HY828_18280 [Actinobacteria bacterium]|nr:hypothetical protein [Actinomycetota bacterium]